MKENRLVQEALIQMKQVEEAIAENAKGILASTMKEEINQLVKESLSEQDDEDEVELDADMDMSADNDEVDMDMDLDDESEDMEMDFDMDSDETPIDLTDASDEEILKVFKAMGENDGIIVKKDGENVHLTDDNADVEYLVKLGESKHNMMDYDSEMMEEDEMEEYEMEEYEMEDEMMEETDESVDDVIDAIFSGDMSGVDSEDDEDVVYEITLDDEMMEEDDMEDSEMMEEDDMEDSEMMEEDDMEDLTNETYKPKGVGMGKPKFSYKKTTGGFKEDMKQGPKSVGTGKAKFDYKKGENMEGKSKVVKAETKEGNYGMNKGEKSRTMKGKEDYTTKKGMTNSKGEKAFEGNYGMNKGEKSRTMKGKEDYTTKKGMTNSKGEKAFEKEETKEAARTYGMGSKEGRGLRKGITNNRNYVYGKNGVKVESTQEEVRMLREKNEEYRKALNVFREKLNEVAIFNSNLAYATRLFTEHSTTKKEKINILRRFDDVETLKESKNLYKSVKDELSKVETKSINESVGAKLNKTVTTGSSTTLIESKTYENPQFLRMKDLMGKLG
jgi:hypothetical protein